MGHINQVTQCCLLLEISCICEDIYILYIYMWTEARAVQTISRQDTEGCDFNLKP